MKKKIGSYLVLLFLVVAVWQAAIWIFALPSYIVATPYSVFAKMAGSYAKVLAVNTLITMAEILGGFLMGIAVGGCLSLFIIFSKFGEIIRPLVISLKSLPKFVFVPLILFFLGQGFIPICIIVTLVCFFPIVVSFTNGLLDVDEEVINYCKTLKMNEMEILWKVRSFFALPVIFSGLKSAFMYSINGALIAEFFLSDQGLGHIIWTGGSYLDMKIVYAGAIWLCIISISSYEGIIALEKKVVHWKKENEVYI
jgi:NitT/TauT family transport system permease protein